MRRLRALYDLSGRKVDLSSRCFYFSRFRISKIPPRGPLIPFLLLLSAPVVVPM